MERIETMMLAHDGVLDVRGHRELRSVVWRMVRSGLLRRVHRGVYVSTSADHATRLRAISVWQPDAVVVGRHAVAVLRNETIPNSKPEVICPRRQRAQAGVVLKTQVLPRDRVRRVAGIQIAGPAYLAIEASSTDGGDLMDDMLRLGLAEPDDFQEALASFIGRPAAAQRRRRVREGALRPFSKAERRTHALLRKAGITGWVANRGIRVDGRLTVPDIRFLDARLVLEVDGKAFHSSDEAFENDRERQNALAVADYRVLRITWKMLTRNPKKVVRSVRALLALLGCPA